MEGVESVTVLRYLLIREVPEIDGLPGDILVWEYPRVSLYRQVRVGEQVTLLSLLPQHWAAILMGDPEGDGPFSPLDDSPSAASLLQQLPARHRQPSVKSSSSPSHLRLA
jgi:hypothetical protein